MDNCLGFKLRRSTLSSVMVSSSVDMTFQRLCNLNSVALPAISWIRATQCWWSPSTFGLNASNTVFGAVSDRNVPVHRAGKADGGSGTAISGRLNSSPRRYEETGSIAVPAELIANEKWYRGPRPGSGVENSTTPWSFVSPLSAFRMATVRISFWKVPQPPFGPGKHGAIAKNDCCCTITIL